MTDLLDSRSPKLPNTPGPPQATLSAKVPIVNKNKTKQIHIPKHLTIGNIKCRSIVEKRTELKYFTDQTKPDIIIGTESWLNDNHYNSEIFDTEQYSIFCKDRKGKRGGGVFLAIKHSLNPKSQPELDSSAEVSLAKVDIPGLKNVYICSYFKPKEKDEDSLEGV